MDNKIFLTEEFTPLSKTPLGDARAYPTVSITQKHVTFNRSAAKILGSPDKVKWLTSTNYILVVPADKNDSDGYCYRAPGRGAGGGSHETTLPQFFVNQAKLKNGLYRCFEFKNGLVFDRYSPEMEYAKGEKRKNQYK